MNKLAKGVIGLWQLAKSPQSVKEVLLNNYQRHYAGWKKVPGIEICGLLDSRINLVMENCRSENGNVSSYELMCISAVCSYFQPLRVLEIGTFDGNTTLQMALNSPTGGAVFTMDLPEGQAAGELDTDEADLQFITGRLGKLKRFENTPVEGKIRQIYADSARFDFSALERVDMAFIDGSHSYEYVKNDTEKVLPILSRGGVMVWHDYTPNWMGVWRYLNELSDRMELKNIIGTTLVVHVNQGA